MFRIFLIIFFIAASAALWVLHGAAKIGAGYSAKQLCSGVFISHLPSDFVVEKDIIPRLKTVAGMDRFAKVAVGETSATVSILTATATASYRDRYGCTLHAEETANAETLEQERVERSAAIETVKSTTPSSSRRLMRCLRNSRAAGETPWPSWLCKVERSSQSATLRLSVPAPVFRVGQ